VIVIHCIAGRHRAAGATALTRAVLMGDTFEEASAWIAQRRDTDISGFCRDKVVAKWLQETTRATERRDGYLANQEHTPCGGLQVGSTVHAPPKGRQSGTPH